MKRSDKVSLKAFWETVEQRLATYSADKLRAILRAMAQETPPSGRRAFLASLERVEGAAADALVNDVRGRFPSHRAFQADMDNALWWMERGQQ